MTATTLVRTSPIHEGAWECCQSNPTHVITYDDGSRAYVCPSCAGICRSQRVGTVVEATPIECITGACLMTCSCYDLVPDLSTTTLSAIIDGHLGRS